MGRVIMKKSCLIVLLCLFSLWGVAYASYIYVPDEYGTIQEAIDMAAVGDRVVVRDGRWTGEVSESVRNKNLDFRGKGITVTSESGPANCIIDCEGSGRGVHFSNGETSDSVLTGFTITGGVGNGAGIYTDDSSPTISQNIITKNSGYYGGGIYCNGSSNPLIIGNTIIENTGTFGGAICCNNSVQPIIANNVISANSSSTGGGLHCEYTDGIIVNNTIFNNEADKGGGIYCIKSSDVTLVNTIVRGNRATQGSQIAMVNVLDKAATLTVSYSNVEGGETAAYVDPVHTLAWLSGNINADPLFKDSEKDDFHLTAGSSCINAGNNDAPDLPRTDKDENPRISGAIVDMGAYEYINPSAYVSPDGECYDYNPCYYTIQEAIECAPNEATIKAFEGDFDEYLILNSAKNLRLEGGWDSTFTSQTSYTAANCLIIRQGKIITYNLVLKQLIEASRGGPAR